MEAQQIKKALWNYCFAYAETREKTAMLAMESAQRAANGEGKSSAGDKYETGRAMMQIERDQAAQQLQEAMKLKEVLRLVQTAPTSKVGVGSIVTTPEINFYIAISAGSFIVEGREFVTVAANAPVAKSLFGLRKGDTFTFRSKTHTVEELL